MEAADEWEMEELYWKMVRLRAIESISRAKN
jgi:hypothetical protein